MVESVVIRRAQVGDFEQLVDLQNTNSRNALSAEQIRDGFLSAQFSAEQYERMNEDLCVIVGVRGAVVKAFLCMSTPQFNMDFALPRTMIDRFSDLTYESESLSAFEVCIGGPVFVDFDLRGQGILSSLYEFFCQIAPAQYSLITSFVSTDNPRSIRAHEKLGLQEIDNFEFNLRRYVTIAGRVSAVRRQLSSVSG